MNLVKSILALILALAFGKIYAAGANNVKQFNNHKDWNFVENKGQLNAPGIKFYGHQGGIYLFCKPGKISFVFTKTGKESKQISEATGQPVETQCLRLTHALAISHMPLPRDAFKASLQRQITTNKADLVLLGSNPSTQIIASNQQEYYENFYLSNTPEEGITNVHTYKTITYKNIYPFIDLVLHTRKQGMKYEFVVYPGGNVNDIQMQWNGLENIIRRDAYGKRSKNSGIEYCSALGSMQETKPVSFQGMNQIKSRFSKSNNIISFKTGRYDKTQTLVIDPSLVWGTYFGGSGEDEGNGLTIDASGNMFMTGWTTSTTGIATSGAYQTTYSGGKYLPHSPIYNYGNSFIAKFSGNGQIQWATYYGDSSYASGIASDSAGNLFITGSTTGKSSIASKGTYLQTFPYKSFFQFPSAFLAKFDNKGFRRWGTYYGGSDNDAATGIATDASGNVYITGETGSAYGIATKGAYQIRSGFFSVGNESFGIQDAFLAKFNSNGAIQWGTYYGSNGSNENMGGTGISGITIDHLGNVYIVGTTGSPSNIATNGAYKGFIYGSLGGSGVEDGFIAKFNEAGARQWATYFGDSTTQIRSVTVDTENNIYITGNTSDTKMATAGTYQTFNVGNNAFLSKFSSSGNKQWATYYGGPLITIGFSVCVDRFGNPYIAGRTTSTSGIATKDAYQTGFNNNNGSASDGFLAKFSSRGTRVWSTYFGEDSEFYYGGLCADVFGNVYLTGTTISNSDISTSGSYQTSYGGGNGDAFLAKFRIIANNDAGIASLYNPVPSVCKGIKSVKVQLQNYGLHPLDSALIGWSVNGQFQRLFKWSGNLAPDSTATVILDNYDFSSGTYIVKSWTSNPNGTYDSLPGNDTFTTIISVNAPLPIANVGQGSYAICTGTHIKIGANAQPDYTYSWSSVPPGFSSTLPDPVVNPTSNTQYYLTVTDTLTGCTNNNSANISVSILPAPVVNVGTNQSICVGTTAQIGSGALSGDAYMWTSNPTGFSSSIANPFISPILTTSYSLTLTSAQGCTNFDSVTITVNPRPLINTGMPLSLCAGLVIHLGGPPTPGYTYSWTSKPSGFFSNLSNPIDSPRVSTEYYLKETIASTGCADSGNIFFEVFPQPAVPIISIKTIGGFEYRFILKNPDSAANYTWKFGDSTATKNALFSDSIMLHVYSGNGIYKIAVNAIESHCEAYAKDSIDINRTFSLDIFPNPFGLQTGIQYMLTSPAHVKISMMDEIGRNIGTLLDKQLPKGEYNTTFSGAAWKTRPGMYFILFQVDDKVIVKKIIQIDSIFY